MTTATTCPYCGVGCGVIAGDAATVAGDPRHPANRGKLCSKGSALGETLIPDSRLLYPSIHGQRVGWDEAVATVAERFAATIAEHGPDSVALYVSGQLLTEDYYVANKLMKGFVGSANIDTNSRLCMASAVAGHRRAFGEDVVPGCYEDWELCDLMVLVGSNTAWCHPILYQRLLAARQQRGVKIVVIDPRRTATCDEADLHLAIRPGTDVLLFNGLLAYLDQVGATDPAYMARHTRGWVESLAAARDEAQDLARVAEHCGLAEADLRQFYDWFAQTQATVTAFSMGVNQSSQGTDKVNAILNCHLATGRVGKPGASPFSITGQPNAMGGREVGGLANQLAAHMHFDNPFEIDRVRRFWNAPRMATKPGLKAVDMFRAVADGRIKAIWIMATNPVVSLPDAGAVRAALQACPFVVVSDCIADTDTGKLAHVLLPATGWSEKDGTVTNSERRISRQRAFRPASGEARHDWWALAQVARAMGFANGFDWPNQAAIFREHAALSAFENAGTRAFDIGVLAELDDAAYEALRPIQWPVTHEAPVGTRRLFADGKFSTPDRLAVLLPVRHKAPANSPADDFPLILNTGRIRDQWHTMTRTGLVPRLAANMSEPTLDLHPADAAKAGLNSGGLVRVRSRWGAAVARVRVTAAQQVGQGFLPMHWTEAYTADGVAGRLVNPAFDPFSGQPELKHTPVQLEAVETGWAGLLVSRRHLRPNATYFARAAVEGGQLYELAGPEPATEMAEHWFGMLDIQPGDEVIEYRDARRGVLRLAVLRCGVLAEGLFAGPPGSLPASRDSLTTALASDGLADDATRRSLLSGRLPGGNVGAGRTVCACFNVGLLTIQRAIAEQGLTDVKDIGKALKAGTNCGSCVPELRGLLAEVQQRALAAE